MNTCIFVLNKAVWDAQNITANANSAVVDISEVSGCAVQLINTGTVVGTLHVDASNDNSNWGSIANAALSGASSVYVNNFANVHYRYIRLRFIFTSGASTFTAYISGKAI